MGAPYLTLEDALGTVYTFPPSFWIDDVSWKIRSSVKQKTFAVGGKETGDGFPETRFITVAGVLRSDTLAEQETKERALKQAVLKGGYLRVSDDIVARRITVKSPSVSENFQGGYRLEKPLSIAFLAESPFWENDTESVKTQVIAATPTDFNVDNTGSDFLLYPVIEIEADQGVNVPSVYLRNLNDGGMAMIYNDPNFVIGDILIIDCGTGSVRRNNNDTIEYMTTARFLRLQPNVNTFRYEGANCTIRVKWRKAYL